MDHELFELYLNYLIDIYQEDAKDQRLPEQEREECQRTAVLLSRVKATYNHYKRAVL